MGKKSRAAVIGLGVLVNVCAGQVSFSQDAKPQQQAFKSLVSAGFQVRSVTYVPIDAVRRGATHPETAADAVIVTLQSATAVAVCTYSISGWESMTQGSMESPAACDVRYY